MNQFGRILNMKSPLWKFAMDYGTVEFLIGDPVFNSDRMRALLKWN